jgi:hypothetical protein
MSTLWRVTLAGLASLAACSPSDEAPAKAGEAPDQIAAGSLTCEILTVADVQAATGVSVKRIERNPAIGAGGTCVNFAGADGQAYLGVNRLNGAADYSASVGAVPEDVYPTKEPIAGLGEEAVLFKGPGGLRYLVARQGASGVVLFPLGEGFNMSDQQLRDLAAKALASAQ